MYSDNSILESTEKMAAIVNREKPFNVSLEIIPVGNNSHSSSLQIGSSVKIKFMSERDCYLTLVDMGTSGNAYIILPNMFNLDNFVRGGRPVYLPQGDEDVAAMIQGPAGIEKIKAFATEKPLNLFDLDFSNLNSASLTFSSNVLAEKAEKIAKKLSKEPSSSWCDALCEFRITQASSIPPVL